MVFCLSASVTLRSLLIEVGLKGLLPGEKVLLRESVISLVSKCTLFGADWWQKIV
jgi:hypothetical protein